MRLGTASAKGSLINGGVNADQYIALFDHVAGFEIDGLNHTGYLIGNPDAVNGFNTAHGLDGRCPGFVLSLNGGNLRRRLGLGHLLLHLAKLVELVAEDASEHYA